MPSPPSIPDHTLLRPVGRGAYGEVWLARNIMNAPRAVKIIWRRQFESDRPYDREFAGIQGYEPVSRTTDGLVQVLHVGRNDEEGYFYYVMELADSISRESFRGLSSSPVSRVDADLQTNEYSPRTLRSEMERRGRLPATDCLNLALDLTAGLICLHRHGLVHRDVKPGNIIFVNGRAKLADIGLVSTHNEGRTFVGTEGYIPPEGPGSPAADIYALGMVLYEAVTGYTPERFPKVPPEWFAENASVEPLEFHEVVLKACEGDKERRYESAEELQADLALLQSGHSVRRVRAMQRRANWSRRLAWVAGVAIVATLGSILLGSYRVRVETEQRKRETAFRQQAERAQAAAEKAERRERERLFISLLEQARATVRSGEMGQRVRALEAIGQAAAISNTVELRREVFGALALPDLRLERELSAGADANFVRLDPSFERYAVSRAKGPVEIRAVSDDRLLVTLPASTNLPSFVRVWSDDGRFLAVKRDYDAAGRYADWEIWDVAAERRALLLRNVSLSALSFHPRQPQLLARQSRQDAAIWNLEDGQELARFPAAGASLHLKFAPNGDHFASVMITNGEPCVLVHNARDGSIQTQSPVFSGNVNALAWHPDGRWLAVVDHSGAVYWMDARTGETRLLGRHKLEAVRAVFSPDGAYLFTAGWELEFICWDARTLRRAFTMSLNSDDIQVSADGQRCGVLTQTGVRLFAFDRPAAHREFAEDLGGGLRFATISWDGRWLAASANQRACVWDLSRSAPGAIETNTYDARFYFTTDGRELLSSHNVDGKASCCRWQLTPGTNEYAPPQLTRLPLHKPQDFASLDLLSNQVLMVSDQGSQVLTLDELDSEQKRWSPTIPGLSGISPDGRWLGIYRPYGTTLHVYRLPDLQPTTKLTYPSSIGDFQFSPLGDEVAIASTRAGAEFWSTTTWQRTRALTNCMRVLYARDARTLWLTRDQRTAGLYDARTLQPLLLLPAGMLPLALSPDERHLAVGVDARRVQVWDLALLQRHMKDLGLDWLQ